MNGNGTSAAAYLEHLASRRKEASRRELLEAGSCCGSGCDDCPYVPRHRKGATGVAPPERKEAAAPAPTTVGRLMFEEIVPEDLRGDAAERGSEITARTIGDILERVANERPEAYREISHKLLRLGTRGSVETNTSFSLDDLDFPGDRLAVLRRIESEEAKINAHPVWSDQEKEMRRMALWREWGEKLPEQVFRAGTERGSGLAAMVASGARGSKGQLNSNVGMDMAVSDAKGRQIPVPIKHSYSQGLDPAEYFAASYGTRLGIVATKFSCSGDTMVRMADGSAKRIEDICPGDWVAGSDKEGNVLPVRVMNRFDHGMQPCRRHSFRVHATQSMVTIEATDDHKMLVAGNPGGRVAPLGEALDRSDAYSVVASWEEGKTLAEWVGSEDLGAVQTYDLEVDHPDHLFVLANGLITSNSVQQGGYFCFSGDTRVRMADGTSKEIQDIGPGDWVVGSTKDGTSLPVRVLRTFRNGVRAANRYVFRHGRSRSLEVSVVSTEGHEVMARHRVMTRKEALESDVLVGRVCSWKKLPIGLAEKGFAMMPSGEFEPNEAEEEPLGFLVGFALGDGMMRDRRLTLTIGDQDLDVMDYLRSILSKEGYDLRKINRAQLSYEYSVVEQRVGRYFTRDSDGKLIKKDKNPLRAKIRGMGVWGKLAHEKTLPADAISKWDNKSLWGLVGGLIASDGCVTKHKLTPVPQVILAITSEKMCQGFYEILTKRLGVHCLPPIKRQIIGTPVGRVGPHPDRGYVANHDLWVVVVSHFDSIKRMAENIELPGRKGRFLREWLAAAPEEDLSGRGGFAYHFLRSEPVGDVEVFDIEVDHPDHLYVLDNGMVVSNSKQLNASAGDLIVTEEDCGTANGLPVDPSDRESVGAVLARDFGGVAAGTVITPQVLAMMSKGARKGAKAVVRSPVSCRAKHGGLCQRCSGIREKNEFPEIGENVGINAASGLSEPVSQALLCLAEGTLVRMADGSVKPIEGVEPGDMVLGSDKDGRLRPVEVVRRYDNGPREVWRFKFGEGQKKEVFVESTLDHKIRMGRRDWAKGGGRLVSKVEPIGSMPGCYRALFSDSFDDSGMPDEEWALFVGLMLGDGCCTEGVGSANFSCADPLLVDDTREYLEGLNLKLTKLKGHPRHYRFSQIEQADAPGDEETGRMVGGEDRNPAKVACKRFGVWGKCSYEKAIPREVWGWSNKSVADLVAGLFATDRSIYLYKAGKGSNKINVSFGSTSKEMVDDLRTLLMVRFGIRACVNKPDTDGQRRKRPLHSLTISSRDSVERFLSVVNIPGVKARKVASFLDGDHPVSAPTRARTGLPMTGKEKLGLLPTYDLEVDHPDHLFVLANGIQISNSTKHSAGVASAGGANQVRGFPQIDALAQVPSTYPNAASLAGLDGTVEKIEEAPQGGAYVHVGGRAHYVPPGRDVLVSKGDSVEAGDALSSGTPNPAEVVRHKGVGAGRAYFVKAFMKALEDNGTKADRRNTEVLARALVNHVRVGDEYESRDLMPGDVVEYSLLERSWVPSASSARVPARKAVGKFLQRPALHYTVGTRITPSVAKDLESAGETEVDASDDAPSFEPVMVRAMDNPAHKDDFMLHTGQSYVKRNLLADVQSGTAKSEIHGKHFAPALARGTEFGRPPKGKVGY